MLPSSSRFEKSMKMGAVFRKRCCLPLQDRRRVKQRKQLNYVQISWKKVCLGGRKHTEKKEESSLFCLL
jgi:hypothetical protein